MKEMKLPSIGKILRTLNFFEEPNEWAIEASAQIALANANANWRRELSKKYRIIRNDHSWLSLNHEAAHAVFALSAELDVEEVSIDTDSFSFGGNTVQSISPKDQMLMADRSIEGKISLKIIMMAMAGPIYENIISSRYEALHDKDDDDPDMTLWRSYLKRIFPKLNPRQLISVELVIADFVQKLCLHDDIQKMIRNLDSVLSTVSDGITSV